MGRVKPPVEAIDNFLYPNAVSDISFPPKRIYTREDGKFVGIGWTGRANRIVEVKPDGTRVRTYGSRIDYVVLDSQLPV